MPPSFSAFGMLLARQRGPLEHRTSGALTGPWAAHLLALTTASRPGIPATAEACLGTGTCRRRALSCREDENGEQCRSKICSHNLIVGIINIGAKALQVLHTPHGVLLNSSQGTKEEKPQGALTTCVAIDAIINSGPQEADANPIQVIDDAERMPLPRSGHGESSKARSCRCSTL